MDGCTFYNFDGSITTFAAEIAGGHSAFDPAFEGTKPFEYKGAFERLGWWRGTFSTPGIPKF